jgi:hypothetical protein
VKETLHARGAANNATGNGGCSTTAAARPRLSSEPCRASLSRRRSATPQKTRPAGTPAPASRPGEQRGSCGSSRPGNVPAAVAIRGGPGCRAGHNRNEPAPARRRLSSAARAGDSRLRKTRRATAAKPPKPRRSRPAPYRERSYWNSTQSPELGSRGLCVEAGWARVRICKSLSLNMLDAMEGRFHFFRSSSNCFSERMVMPSALALSNLLPGFSPATT